MLFRISANIHPHVKKTAFRRRNNMIYCNYLGGLARGSEYLEKTALRMISLPWRRILPVFQKDAGPSSGGPSVPLFMWASIFVR